MGKNKNPTRGISLLLPAALLLISGCGSRETSQSTEPSDVEIFYHADNGEFQREGLGWDAPTQESGSEEGSATEDEEKTVITLAAVADAHENEVDQITEFVAKFNQENEKYQIELRTCRLGEELETMRDRLSVEVGAGGGPDLLTSEVFPVSQEIMDSGTLAELNPYLEKSGITPEKYFPAYAPIVSGDRIYGVCMDFVVVGYGVDPRILGDSEPPEDLETLVDMLLEYPEQGSLMGPRVEGRYILAYFLEGSKDLWGMVDWEKMTCDFTGPLFSKILDVTKRYREDGKKGYEPVLDQYVVKMQLPPTESISILCPGMVPVGFYFDDGPHYKYQVSGNTLMINANTEHLEGAYAFVSYALSKEGQNLVTEPVNKEMWDTGYQYYTDMSGYGASSMPLNEETRKETVEAYEDARFIPRRAEEILEIVYEEADGYIEGDRSKEEVIDMIQNRVQLYLDEQG